MLLETMSQVDLEIVILENSDLYAMFDEQRLLNSEYSLEQMKEIVGTWIEQGDECS